jgi:hypothetical protein
MFGRLYDFLHALPPHGQTSCARPSCWRTKLAVPTSTSAGAAKMPRKYPWKSMFTGTWKTLFVSASRLGSYDWGDAVVPGDADLQQTVVCVFMVGNLTATAEGDTCCDARGAGESRPVGIPRTRKHRSRSDGEFLFSVEFVLSVRICGIYN